MNKTTAPHAPDAILEELQTLVEEAERLADDPAADSGNGVDTLRDRFETVQDRFEELCAGAKERLAAGARDTDELVRENPYPALAIALGVGVLLGLAIGRPK